jgi:hypothetical protein
MRQRTGPIRRASILILARRLVVIVFLGIPLCLVFSRLIELTTTMDEDVASYASFESPLVSQKNTAVVASNDPTTVVVSKKQKIFQPSKQATPANNNVEEAVSDIREHKGSSRAIKGNNGTDPHQNPLLQQNTVKPESQHTPESNTTSHQISSNVILSNKQRLIVPVETSVSNVTYAKQLEGNGFPVQSSAQRTEQMELPSPKTEKTQSPDMNTSLFVLVPTLGNTSVLRASQDPKQEKDDARQRKTDSKPQEIIRGNGTTVLRLSHNARFVRASSSTHPQRPDVRYKPQSKVIRKRIDAGDLTAGQFVLDFAILGFPKCGTSTMSTYCT